MKTPHALGLVLVAIAATVAIEESRIASLRGSLASATANAASVASPASSPPSPNPAAKDPSPATRTAKTDRAAKSDSPKPADEKDGPEDFSKTVRKMWDNPAGKAMMNQGVKIAVAMMYEDYLGGLSLSKEESDYFKNLLGKDISDQQELGMKMMGGGVDMKELQAEMDKRKASNEGEIKAFLNDDEDFKNYTAYRDRLPERQQLEGIRATMNSKSASLDAATEQKLIDAMYTARTQSDAPDYSGPKAFEELSKGNLEENFESGWQKQDAKLTAETAKILNPEQQAAFLEYRKQAKEMQLMGIKMAQQMMSGKKDK
ncbi:hypothetical protein [Haloferula sp. BvORR071]|uniref:hypothetical protein n=1 Tax=Haloferula sp. BvORR071 TaxID=1396141 RepID=UPI0005521B31|nr:hypothetical protein [Haloferula sp. BvORR071]